MLYFKNSKIFKKIKNNINKYKKKDLKTLFWLLKLIKIIYLHFKILLNKFKQDLNKVVYFCHKNKRYYMNKYFNIYLKN